MQINLIAITKYLNGNGTPEELLEHAGRICYQSESKGNPGAFLKRRIKEGHESLIEHASATFEIDGISRACSHQLVRHRISSVSQASQRYIDMSSPTFVTPSDIEKNPKAKLIYDHFLSLVPAFYSQLRELGINKEDARFILPNATTTRLVVTMNFRAWRHFIKERGLNPAAQWEIRDLALKILDILYKEAPSVFEDLINERDKQTEH